jgi:hypothetical protein
MKRANAFLLLAVATLVFAPGRVLAGNLVRGTVTAEIPTGPFSGHVYYDLTTKTTRWENNPAPLAAVDVYSNTSSPAIFAVSSTDLGAVWGDEVFTANTGILDQADFTLFNAKVSAGPLQTGSFYVDYLDAGNYSYMGGLKTGVIDFGPEGLAAGFYTIITVTGLAALGVNLTTTDVLIEQGVLTHSGPATRLGVVGLDPVTVGTGTATMFISASTIGAGGYYAIGGILMANPGYRITVQHPVPAKRTTWGSVKGLYR